MHPPRCRPATASFRSRKSRAEAIVPFSSLRQRQLSLADNGDVARDCAEDKGWDGEGGTAVVGASQIPGAVAIDADPGNAVAGPVANDGDVARASSEDKGRNGE